MNPLHAAIIEIYCQDTDKISRNFLREKKLMPYIDKYYSEWKDEWLSRIRNNEDPYHAFIDAFTFIDSHGGRDCNPYKILRDTKEFKKAVSYIKTPKSIDSEFILVLMFKREFDSRLRDDSSLEYLLPAA